MNIDIATPVPRGSRKGNRVTAVRWAHLLRQLGHRVRVSQGYRGGTPDVLVALHASRSAEAVEAFCRDHPRRPVVVALTGTDLYDEIHTSAPARRSLELASRLVVLQPLGIKELPAQLQAKARVIFQSAEAPPAARPRNGLFDICVLGHLRPVKDPFCAASAARLLPTTSRVQVLHVGAALSPEMEEAARAETATNSRYHWLGELPRWKALRVLGRSRLLVVTSRSEGGANAVSEAIAASVPVLSSNIPGSVGILGDDYPGYFPAGDVQALAELLSRAEEDASFYRTLRRRCRALRPLVRPTRERESWRRLLRELRPA
jgi:putative glycosyltransferase (TIGR04348 family)